MSETLNITYIAKLNGIESYEARCTAALTYNVTQTDTTVTIELVDYVVGGIYNSAPGGSTAYDRLNTKIRGKLESAHFFKINGETVYSREQGVDTYHTYHLRNTRTFNRTTSTYSVPVSVETWYDIYGEITSGSASVSIPALQSWPVTYNANSGGGAPATQTKYYTVDLYLSSVVPYKEGYKFNGWATSEANAKAGTVAYAAGATYSGNAALDLWAVWELAYTKPVIKNVKVDRCKSDGTLDDEGGYAKVTFDWSVYNTAAARYYGGNTYPYSSNGVSACSIVITDGTITKTATPTLSGSSGTSQSVTVGDGTFDINTQYSVSITITDSQAIYNDKTTTISDYLAMSRFPMDINSNATAVAFLMPAPDNDAGVFIGDDLDVKKDIKVGLDVCYGTSSESASTTTKRVTVTKGSFTLASGAWVVVKFTNTTSTSTSLNVDSTGSKQAYYNGSRISSSNGAWSAGDTVIFQYDGSYYQKKLPTDSGIPADVLIAYYGMVLGWSDCFE